MRRFLFAAACLLAAPAAAQPAPKLTVEISVDGLSSQLLIEYRPLLSGGLARIDVGELPATAGRNIVVAGSEASAKSLGGSPSQRWYWSGDRFASDLGGSAPKSIAAANTAIAREIATAQPALDPPPDCLTKAARAGGFARAAGDAAAFRQSPEGDGATLAVSAALVRELGLGRGAQPDRLAIGLTASGDIARKYGAGSQEMCLEVHSLDRDLGDFLAQLDAWKIPYQAILKTH